MSMQGCLGCLTSWVSSQTSVFLCSSLHPTPTGEKFAEKFEDQHFSLIGSLSFAGSFHTPDSATFERECRPYPQPDTYGASDRVSPGKVRQSIQLDQNGARVLKRLLERTFPGI